MTRLGAREACSRKTTRRKKKSTGSLRGYESCSPQDPNKGTVIWKLQKSLYGLRSASRRWQDHLEEILRKRGFVSNILDTCLWTHPTKRISLVFHVDALLLAGTHQNISEILAELKRDLELKSSEVTTKPTRGRTLVRTEEGYNFGVDTSYVENLLEEFNMTALKSSPNSGWNAVRPMSKSCQRANKECTDSLLGNCYGSTEWCAVRWEKPHQVLDERAAQT